MTPEEIAEEYLALRDANADIEREAKRLQNINKERMAVLEQACLKHVVVDGNLNVQTAKGNINRDVNYRFKCEDWPVFYDWLHSLGSEGYAYLHKRLTDAEIRSMIEDENLIPPGITFEKFDVAKFTVPNRSTKKKAERMAAAEQDVTTATQDASTATALSATIVSPSETLTSFNL